MGLCLPFPAAAGRGRLLLRPGVNSPLAVPASTTASAEGSAAQKAANRGIYPPWSCSEQAWHNGMWVPLLTVMLGKCSDSLGSSSKIIFKVFKDWRNSLEVGFVSSFAKIKLGVAGIAVSAGREAAGHASLCLPLLWARPWELLDFKHWNCAGISPTVYGLRLVKYSDF